MSAATTVLRFRELTELESVSARILEFGKHIPIWLFQGHMGAGKTTLIRSLCKTLGVTSSVHSPTFSLVNEYISADKKVIYHFDFYRIKNEVEALDIGVEEYFDSGDFCFVEWPSKIEGLWPEHYLLINLSLQENGVRVLEAEEIGKL
ncbi:tRNA (adenosine(37)-N6)-threonylcarbamoyltransferase complex ATPase subunit type 1 TsaE [Dyadobacter sp. CY312]|uniref:tRNA (adenosine(37)-N6)-threonylcarbamoyltransferase complex ATPase subunit type 1 TsaE n=1 Tax=Dyadobacter sp. CY312 TaxID=2907303 RepID=UPI001F0132FF|nr:tRNA (adenosine(37)-N6)-threonylcarbamoyltransferase complex ATPase subunit type 1 TsaE [Dyadobacter sp. CY312]MCE7040871.1 tRNA (adenosine(37)-N6)-threonylcarbamoyltransferase complex ATPase subunit type 1 TsaE [Dyadobacter sp. CY312]